MTEKKLKAVRVELTRMQTALAAYDRREDNEHHGAVGTREAGTVKRASLDLSRALSELRKPG